MANYPDLEIVDLPEMETKSKRIFRLYRTSIKGSERHSRYHFGFPKDAMLPLLPVLKNYPGWESGPWKEVDGFMIWATEATGRELPTKDLARIKEQMSKSYHRVIKTTEKLGQRG